MNHRIFIAINFPDDLKKSILDSQNKLKKFGWPVRWVGETNMHLTLKFLGSINEESLKKLRQIVGGVVSRYKLFTIEFKDLLAFPTLSKPRVIGVAILENQELENLANDLRKQVDEANIGEKEVRPFQGHVTIGRVKNPRGHWQALSKIDFSDSFTVKSVEIMESILKPEGPVYKVVETFQLRDMSDKN